MYCKFCGRQIEDNSVFCKHCGKKLTEESTTPPQPPKPDQTKNTSVSNTAYQGNAAFRNSASYPGNSGPSTQSFRPQKSRSKGKTLGLVLGSIAAVFVVISVAISLFGNRSGGKPSNEPYVPKKETVSQIEDMTAGADSDAFIILDMEAYSSGVIQFLNSHDNYDYMLNSYSVPNTELDQVRGYVELLEQYGFSVRDMERGDAENDICWVFDYNGKKELEPFTLHTKDETFLTDIALYLSLVPMEGSDITAIAFCYPYDITLGDGGNITVKPEVLTTVPDPARYFAQWSPDDEGLSKDGTAYTVTVEFPIGSEYSDGDLESVLLDYMQLLADYGFVRTGEEEEGDSVFAFFAGEDGTNTVSRYGFENEPAAVTMVYHRTAQILMVHYSSVLTADSNISQAVLMETQPTPTPKPETPKVTGGKVSASNVQIPDFGAFTGIDLEVNVEEIKASSTNKDYIFKTNEKVVNEYIKLLTEKYNFTIRQDYENVIRTVTLDYTGTGSVSTFDVRKQKGVSVYLWIYHNPSTEFQVTYGDGLEYVDNGDRTTQTIQRTDGNSGGGGGSNNDDSTWHGTVPEIKCTKCHGEKTVACTNCDGKGYKEKVVESPNFGGGIKRETVKEKCYKCSNGQITCPRCGGTGKQ